MLNGRQFLSSWRRNRQKVPVSLSSRSIVSRVAEPPLDSSILEKPATILLFEDPDLYASRSWQSSFETQVPNDYGMSFAFVSFPKGHGFDQILQELKADVSAINDAVLVTRGPLSSWCAQSYLESFPLQGLAMFDPIQLDQMDDNLEADEISTWVETMTLGNSNEDVQNWKRLVEEAKDRKLRLEPNAVPMLVFSTTNSDVCKTAATSMAQRHGDGDGLYGHVPLIDATDVNTDMIIAEIDAWVDTII
jgi:hypothetical protein